MRSACLPVLALLTAAFASAVIVDRIAIVVNSRPVKDTDIERDIRLTDFLNGDPLVINSATRKQAAKRLIDQQIIRREVQIGEYPVGTTEEVDKFLNTVKQQRFSGGSAYEDALKRYGVTEPELRSHLQWQITVLRFIDERFRPAVILNDSDIDQYAKAHNLPKDQAEQTLTGEKVNQAFESWLDGAEKRASIQYHEEGLK